MVDVEGNSRLHGDLAPVAANRIRRVFAGSWALVEPPWPHHGAAPLPRAQVVQIDFPGKLAGSEDPTGDGD